MLPLILKQATAILVAIGTLSAGMSAEPALAAQPEATHTVDTAADRNVDLPNHIVNGDFSYPNITDYAAEDSLIFGEYARWGYVIPSNGTVETDRQTGDKAVKIRDWDASEFGWRSDSPSGGVSAFSAGTVEIQQDVKQDVGEQFAEIVAEQDKYAIYQDIATTPGTYLVWTLKHAPRGYSWQNANDSDSMQVLIGSTSKQTPQEAERITSNGTGKVGEKSTTITTHATEDHKFHPWETYTGIYKVPEGQTVTRFTFRALTNSGMSGRTGNLIDDVTFEPMYGLTYDANGGDGQVPSNKTPNTVTRAVRREDGATIVRNIAKSGAVQGCQVLYPASTEITLATLEKDSDCWDSSMLKKTGHHQLGWNTDKNADSAQKTVTMTEGGLTVYAVWQPDTFTVDYNANGGKGTMDAQTATYGVPVTLNRNTFTRDGYTFAGWKTQADGGTGYADGAQITPNANITLYAQWTANKYTVAFNANGGTGTTPTTTGVTDQIVTVSQNGFTRDGYTFLGWNSKPDGTGYDYQPGGDYQLRPTPTILYAQWQAQPATLDYAANAQDATGSTPQTVSQQGEPVTVNDNGYQRPGYTFTGWNTQPDGNGDTLQPGTQTTLHPGTNTTVYAQWTPLPSTITYDANHPQATGSTEPTTGVTGQQVEVNANGFTLDGYTFTGWNTKTDGTGDTIQPGDTMTAPVEGVTLYAQWEANPATLTFDGNGGEGETPAIEGVTDQTVGIPANGYALDGYTFTGWNTEKDGTGVGYQPDDQYVMPAGNTIMYAQWTPNPASVRFDPNGGTGSMDDMHGVTDEQSTLTKNKFENGCAKFAGWNTKPDGSGLSYEDEADWQMRGDIILYAQWEGDPECPTPTQPDEPAEEDKPLALTGVGLLGAAGALLVSLLIAAAAWLASRRQPHGRHR